MIKVIIYYCISYINLGDIIKTIINGTKISFDKTGDGPPIILLHGWGANRNTFSELSKELSDSFCVYSIDLPGFGESEIGVPLGIEEIADLVHNFTLENNINNPIILGHSYGGRIGIVYAAKYDVNKLVLVSSAGVKQKLKIYKRIQVKVFKLLKKCNIKFNVGSKDYKDADNVKRIMLVKAVNQDLQEYMQKIKVPTILIYGVNDKTTPIDVAKIINNNIKNSFLFKMDGCGHFPYLERPSYFLLILMSFLVGDENAC